MGRLSHKFIESLGMAPNDVLIQTGTQLGKGLKYCAPHFKTIHTIELDDRYYHESKRRLAKYKNVLCYHGSSPEVLPLVIDPTRPTTFWLDAHFVATDDLQAQVQNQCPLMQELLAIFAFRWEAKASILVDDAHFFQPSFWRQRRRSRGYDIAQWPRQELLRATVEEFGYSMRSVGDVFAIEQKEQSHELESAAGRSIEEVAEQEH